MSAAGLERVGNAGGRSRFTFSMTVHAIDGEAAKARAEWIFRQAAPGFSVETIECEPGSSTSTRT